LLHPRLGLLRSTLLLSAFSLLLAAPVATADSPTAADLFDQGVSLYEKGELEAARDVLRRVDVMQLPKEQRLTYASTIQDIERRLKADQSPDELLQSAAAAVQQKQMAAAARLYRLVLEHPRATDAQKKAARDSLDQLRLSPDVRRAEAVALLDAAEADLKAGNLDAAQRKVAQVRDSGLDLGWFDNQRVERLSSVIEDRRAGGSGGAETRAVVLAANQDIREVGASDGPGDDVDDIATAEAIEAAAADVQPVNGTPRATAAAAGGAEDALGDLLALEVGQLIVRAEKALDDNQPQLAARYAREALKIDSDNANAKAVLAEAAVASDEVASPTGVADETATNVNMVAEAAKLRYDERMDRARAYLEARNFDAAKEASLEARLVLDNNRRVLTEATYRELRTEAEQLAATIDDRKLAYETEQESKLAEDRAVQIEKRRVQAEREVEEEVTNLLTRARALQRELRYDEALQLLDQVLFLQPGNYAAQLWRRSVADTARMRDVRDIRDRIGIAEAELTKLNYEALIPPRRLVEYPKNWPELTYRRLSELGVTDQGSEINRRTALKMRETLQIRFDGNEFEAVIEFLRNSTGINIFVNWNALELAGVERDQTVNLVLNNVPAEQALRLVLQQVTLDDTNPVSFSIIEGIVHISTAQDLRKATVLRVYDIRDLLVQIPNFTEAPEFDLESALSSEIGGEGGTTTTGIFGTGEGVAGEVGLTRDQLITAIIELIQTTVGNPDDWAEIGTGESSVRELNGNLIVRTTPGNHNQLLQLLGELRETRAIQIHVEARFLLVDKSFLEEVGVDLDASIDLGGPWGVFDIQQDSFGLAEAQSGSIPNFFISERTTTAADSFEASQDDSVMGPAPGSRRALNVGWGYMTDDLQVNLLIRATQGNRRSISLTAPRITSFPGQAAYVVIARQIAFVSDLEPVPDAVGFESTLSVTNSGVVLRVQGTVSADRRYVTLTVQPSLASIVEIRQIQQIAEGPDGDDDDDIAIVNPLAGLLGAGDGDGDGDDDVTDEDFITGNIEAPQLQLTELKTTVSVPDRGTILLGGQRVVDDIEIEAGIPVLSKIPILQRLTSNRSTVQDERTLMILVKPTIIIPRENEDDLFPGLLDDPAAYNTGRAR